MLGSSNWTSGIGSKICSLYANEKTGICNPNCPFEIECTPFFKEFAEEYKMRETNGTLPKKDKNGRWYI